MCFAVSFSKIITKEPRMLSENTLSIITINIIIIIIIELYNTRFKEEI